MSLVKELQDLIAKGENVEENQKKLDEILAEAKAADVEVTKAADAENESIEKAADAIAEKAFEKLSAKMAEEVKTEKVEEKKVVKAQVKAVIIDAKHGSVTADQLSEIKEEIAERKAAGKTHTEVSARTKHFLAAMATGDVQKLQVLTEGSAAAGGYLVPEDFLNMIVEDLRDATVMRQISSQMNTTTDTVHLPRLDTRPQAAWRSEAAVKQTSTAQFSELVFTPYSIASIVTMSQELVDDAQLGVGGSIVNYIAGLITRAIAEKEDLAFFKGDGSGKPTGVLNYSLATTDATLVGNNADAIINNFYGMKQGYRSNLSWVGNAQTIASVRKLKDTTNQYLVTNLAGTPNQLLLGRQIYEQNDVPNGVLLCGDFSYYQIVDRQGISVRVSDEAVVGGASAFEKNLVHVRVEKRVDAELTLTESVSKVIGL
jgi:HK97 family phage major capsid protein